jgi:OFA family oxalate/formate antiporter-like MFS transporter
MFGAQLKMLAEEFGIGRDYFSVLMVAFPLGNGLSRVVAGTVSDRLGRERTMMIFYFLLGLSILSLVLFARSPAVFLVIVTIAALLGGAPFALYPATIGDYYGAKHATTNYGITYTAKAWAGLISGWLSGYLVVQFGSYRFPLIVVALCSFLAAVVSSPRFLRMPEKETP